MKPSAMRLLVVDDDDSVRRLCDKFLVAAGYQVATAPSGKEAVSKLSPDVDIVLTDLELPGGIDGNEVTRRVRASGSADVIIMTGNPNLETAVQAMRDGAYDYLFKPFNQGTLLHAIGRCGAKRALSAELARERELRAELDEAYKGLERLGRLRETFGQFATPEIARYAEDHAGDILRRGERREVSVLFADIRGFTPYAASVAPEDAVGALNEVFGLAIAPIKAEGGILNKFLGDGLMALFGAPVPLNDHAGAAVRAALGAMRGAEESSKAREARGLPPLRMGIGINTGEVVAGCLGTRDRTEYSVIGHAVNLAARLEDAAQAWEVLVGESTARLVSGRFKLSERSLNLQGIDGPVAAFAAVGATTAKEPAA